MASAQGDNPDMKRVHDALDRAAQRRIRDSRRRRDSDRWNYDEDDYDYGDRYDNSHRHFYSGSYNRHLDHSRRNNNHNNRSPVPQSRRTVIYDQADELDHISVSVRGQNQDEDEDNNPPRHPAAAYDQDRISVPGANGTDMNRSEANTADLRERFNQVVNDDLQPPPAQIRRQNGRQDVHQLR